MYAPNANGRAPHVIRGLLTQEVAVDAQLSALALRLCEAPLALSQEGAHPLRHAPQIKIRAHERPAVVAEVKRVLGCVELVAGHWEEQGKKKYIKNKK